ncbi:MAG: RNA polymerase sigma-70 factor [Sediminicola sp.]
MKSIDNSKENLFKSIFNQLFGPLLAYAITFTNDHEQAKDIVQGCFVTLWEKRDAHLQNPNLKTYMHTMVHNSFIDSYRKNLRKDRILEELKKNALEKYRLQERETDGGAKIKHMQAIVETLPPRCKEILLMNKRDGMKYKEIAKKLGVSVKTVESQMQIAFKKIRKDFKKNMLLFITTYFRRTS